MEGEKSDSNRHAAPPERKPLRERVHRRKQLRTKLAVRFCELKQEEEEKEEGAGKRTLREPDGEQRPAKRAFGSPSPASSRIGNIA